MVAVRDGVLQLHCEMVTGISAARADATIKIDYKHFIIDVGLF